MEPLGVQEAVGDLVGVVVLGVVGVMVGVVGLTETAKVTLITIQMDHQDRPVHVGTLEAKVSQDQKETLE